VLDEPRHVLQAARGRESTGHSEDHHLLTRAQLRRAGLALFTRYFAVKTPVDDSQYAPRMAAHSKLNYPLTVVFEQPMST
jgi:hypothetical protein